MRFQHLEFLLEEPSIEVALQILLPRLLAEGATFRLHPFQGKSDLLAKLPARLRAYRSYLTPETGIVVMHDEDRAPNCRKLKAELEKIALGVGFCTKSSPSSDGQFQVINRLCIEELEAWFFGDIAALCAAYPGVPPNLDQKRGFRDSDAIKGGTWEVLERVLQKAGHHRGGLAKMQAARDIAPHMNIETNNSRSFQLFRDTLRAIT
ncbi:protein of unknown function (DUF4276) [Abditibacterium utsteinense]|uniref:DUF4276 family protein n=1 Tax=Abditibacterium utsteinense TaxID=1960156 RepID=A0A2S8SWH3_9BACT|nr:DUF4276 family protein [Abditibacterium utsteinense]PQV65156.1 protein of unknown function (DUF4276) [Abditibacterium utsteinense]